MQAKPATAGGIVMLICAALILLGTISRSWFVMDAGDFKGGTGLMGGYACGKDWDSGKEHCEGKWLDFDTKGRAKDKDIHVWRFGGFFGGLGAGVLAVICGAIAFGNPRKAPLVPLYILTGIAFVFCSMFVVRIFVEMKGSMKPDFGWSFFVDYMGLIGAFVAGVAMIGPAGKQAAPMMHMPMQQPMMMQQYPCPRCGGQLTFVAQYQRWFCPRCQQYA